MPIGLILLAGTVFTFNLGGTRLWDDDEPKNASCGREMLEQSNWIVPTFNGELRPHKPVLLYWGMIVSYLLVGVSEIGARLPSVVASVGKVLICYRLGRLLFDRWTGFAAGFLLTCGLMFAVLSRAATPDAVLILCVIASMYCFVHGVAQLGGGQFGGSSGGGLLPLNGVVLPRLPAIGMYAGMGLATLAKGPVGFLLPMTVITLFALFAPRAGAASDSNDGAGRWPRLRSYLAERLAPYRLFEVVRSLRVVTGMVVLLMVALPWYAAVTVATEGAWLTGFLGTHNVNRFLNPMEGHGGPVFYYVLAILIGFFPGSVFLGPAVVKAVRDQRQPNAASWSQAFLLAWIVTYLVFFTAAATKLPNYIVPCFPAVSLLTAGWLVHQLRDRSLSRYWVRAGVASFAMTGLVLTVALGVVSYLFWNADLLVAVAGVIALVGGGTAWWLLRQENTKPAVILTASSFVLFTALATGLTASRVSPFQTSPRIADQLVAMDAASSGRELQFATFRYTKPNLVFYLGRPVPVLESNHEAIRFFKSHPAACLVLPEDVYQQLEGRLPADVEIVHREPKFMKPDEKVLVVGRKPVKPRMAERPSNGLH
jgi:4-amino-4-deoxy-L-arabinose transferase-like glycosyltransferase